MNNSPELVPSGIHGLKSKTRFLVILLRIHLWLALFLVVMGGVEWYLVNKLSLERPIGISLELADALDFSYINGGYMQLGLWGLTVVVFLVWFSQAYANLKELRANDRQYSTGWAVGGWFIPIANLVVPYNVAKEIWKASSPNAYDSKNSHAWKKANDHSPVREWWILYVVYVFLSRYLFRSSDGESYSDIMGDFAEDIFSNLLLAGLSMLAIRFVRGIQGRQEERLALILDEEQADPTGPLPSSFAGA